MVVIGLRPDGTDNVSTILVPSRTELLVFYEESNSFISERKFPYFIFHRFLIRILTPFRSYFRVPIGT